MKSTRFLRFAVILSLAVSALPALSRSGERPKYEIKFATVAPEGSTWMKLMHKLDAEVREETGGEVGFRIYAGGVQGDETDVIRKMRYGQLHAAGFTGNGLGEILPEIRVLELPFLFQSKDEVDYIGNLLFDRFDRDFREKGYVLLGWTEVGYVYLFSRKPVRSLDDLKGLRVWAWEGDPLAKALFEGVGVTPLPLSLPEVLTGLQTGMLDAVYTTPLAAVSLQWFTRVSYMNLQPLTNATGAVLITRKKFDSLPAEDQEILLRVSGKYLRELTLQSRQDNAVAIVQLEKSGITMVPPFQGEDFKRAETVGDEVKRKLAGKLYSPELLAEIQQALDEYREQHPQTNGR